MKNNFPFRPHWKKPEEPKAAPETSQYLPRAVELTMEQHKLGNYLKNVTTSGLLVPDEGVEDYIREAAGLPKRLDDYVPMPGEDREPGKVRTTQKPKKDTGDKMGGLDDEEPEENPEAVEKARKDLGRD